MELLMLNCFDLQKGTHFMEFNLTFAWRRGHLSSVFADLRTGLHASAVRPLTQHPAWCQKWKSTGQHRLRAKPPPLPALALQGLRRIIWNDTA